MRFTVSVLLTAILIAALPIGSGAQGRADDGSSNQRGNPKRDPIVSLDFEGGTLTQYVAYIRQAIAAHYRDAAANILLDTNAGDVRVPAMTLKHVSVSTALEAATNLITAQPRVYVKRSSPRVGLPVYCVHTKPAPRRNAQPKQTVRTLVRVYSFRIVTEPPAGTPADLKLDAKTVLTAIETGLDFSTGPKATLRYHVDSALLFVRATAEQTQIIESVLDRLESDIQRLRQSAVHASRSRQPSHATNPGDGTAQPREDADASPPAKRRQAH